MHDPQWSPKSMCQFQQSSHTVNFHCTTFQKKTSLRTDATEYELVDVWWRAQVLSTVKNIKYPIGCTGQVVSSSFWPSKLPFLDMPTRTVPATSLSFHCNPAQGTTKLWNECQCVNLSPLPPWPQSFIEFLILLYTLLTNSEIPYQLHVHTMSHTCLIKSYPSSCFSFTSFPCFAICSTLQNALWFNTSWPPTFGRQFADAWCNWRSGPTTTPWRRPPLAGCAHSVPAPPLRLGVPQQRRRSGFQRGSALPRNVRRCRFLEASSDTRMKFREMLLTTACGWKRVKCILDHISELKIQLATQFQDVLDD